MRLINTSSKESIATGEEGREERVTSVRLGHHHPPRSFADSVDCRGPCSRTRPWLKMFGKGRKRERNIDKAGGFDERGEGMTSRMLRQSRTSRWSLFSMIMTIRRNLWSMTKILNQGVSRDS